MHYSVNNSTYAYQPQPNQLLQNENFVQYYKQMMKEEGGAADTNTASVAETAAALKKHKKKEATRAGSPSKRTSTRRNLEDDQTFYNSLSHQLINELVGAANEEASNASTTTVREDVKISEGNTTNHSTGDSQNSSSAEKAETRRGLLHHP